MKKFFNLIMLLFIPLIILCLSVVPTYCATQEYFPADNVYDIIPFQTIDNKQNFYNYSNLQDVYYTNFNIDVNWNYIGSFYGDYSNSGFILGENYYNIDSEISCFNVPIGRVKYTLRISCFDNYNRATYYCEDFIYQMYENVVVNPLNYGLGGIVFDIIPPQYLNFNQNVTKIYWNISSFIIEFDIMLNNQYFYNNYFGLVANLKPFISTNIANASYMSVVKHTLVNGFYTQRNWGLKTFDTLYLSDFVQSQNSNWVLFKNDYSYTNDYVVHYSTSIKPTPTNLNFGSGIAFRNEYFQYNLILNYNYNNEKFVYLYSNTTNNDGLVSSTIIPNGTNDFYKSCEWWDVATHIYNLFIYLIFDAPILSSFTRLVLVMIQFVVSVFTWLINLFNAIDSLFFISVFLGIFFLMFLIKIIFKG